MGPWLNACLKSSSRASWGPTLALLAFACGGQTTGVTPVPGPQPANQAGSSGSDAGHGSGGNTASNGTSNTMGGGGSAAGGGTAPGCIIRGQFPAARITIPLLASVNGTPDGVFSACQNDACVSGLVAGVESVSPYQVRIDVSATFLSMTWLDSKFGGGPDVYSVTFSPAGSGRTVPVFSTLAGYMVLLLAPDTSGVGCPSVAFQAEVQLTEPIDLDGGTSSDAGAGGAAATADDGGAAGARL